MICLDPSKNFKFYLLDDRKEKKNYFSFKFLSISEHYELEAALEAATAEKDDKKSTKMVIDAIKPLIVGWNITDRMGNLVPFDISKLEKYINAWDAWDIRRNILYQCAISEQEIRGFMLALAKTSESSDVLEAGATTKSE